MGVPAGDGERAVFFAAVADAVPRGYVVHCNGCEKEDPSSLSAATHCGARLEDPIAFRLGAMAVKEGWVLDGAGALGCPACSARLAAQDRGYVVVELEGGE